MDWGITVKSEDANHNPVVAFRGKPDTRLFIWTPSRGVRFICQQKGLAIQTGIFWPIACGSIRKPGPVPRSHDRVTGCPGHTLSDSGRGIWRYPEYPGSQRQRKPPDASVSPGGYSRQLSAEGITTKTLRHEENQGVGDCQPSRRVRIGRGYSRMGRHVLRALRLALRVIVLSLSYPVPPNSGSWMKQIVIQLLQPLRLNIRSHPILYQSHDL